MLSPMKDSKAKKSALIFILMLSFIFFSQTKTNAKELYKSEDVNVTEIVSDLESKIYGKIYDLDSINERIDRLEKSVFKQTNSASLIKRAEFLRNYLGKYQGSEIKKQVYLELLENRYFGRSYQNEPVEIRIARLENAIFDKTLEGNISTRFDNLIKNAPLNITGVSVSESSGSKTSYKPFLIPNYSGITQQYSNESVNYFDNIRKNKDNQIFRWSDFPVSIYIEKTNDQELIKSVYKAVETWSDYISFSFVDDVKNSDIIISWDNPNKYITQLVESNNSGEKIIQATINCGLYKNQEYFDRFLAHQIGHAIGIWGHSYYKDDIMYNFKEFRDDIDFQNRFSLFDISIVDFPQKPSTRDINTLIKIYNHRR